MGATPNDIYHQASGLGLTGPVPGNFFTIGTVVVSPTARKLY